MKISLIVAMDINNIIGQQGSIPWHLPADFKHFKNITMGKVIVMGRKTHESIGKCLPHRLNIVVTRQQTYKSYPQAQIVHSLQKAISKAKEYIPHHEIFIIGGGELYQQAMPLADKLYITQILHSFTGDTYFPEIKQEDWTLEKEEKMEANPQNPHAFLLLEYIRKK